MSSRDAKLKPVCLMCLFFLICFGKVVLGNGSYKVLPSSVALLNSWLILHFWIVVAASALDCMVFCFLVVVWLLPQIQQELPGTRTETILPVRRDWVEPNIKREVTEKTQRGKRVNDSAASTPLRLRDVVRWKVATASRQLCVSQKELLVWRGGKSQHLGEKNKREYKGIKTERVGSITAFLLAGTVIVAFVPKRFQQGAAEIRLLIWDNALNVDTRCT